MKPDEIGGIDIFLKNVNDIDKDFPEIEKLIGYKNYAEKPLKNSSDYRLDQYFRYQYCSYYHHYADCSGY
jgi:hypothetical protein